MILGDLRTFTPSSSGIVIVPRRHWEYLSAHTARCAFIARTEEVLNAVRSIWGGHPRGGLAWTVERNAGDLGEGVLEIE